MIVMNFSEVHQSSQALVEAAYPVAAWVALAVAVLGIAFLAAVVSAARRAAALLADFLPLASVPVPPPEPRRGPVGAGRATSAGGGRVRETGFHRSCYELPTRSAPRLRVITQPRALMTAPNLMPGSRWPTSGPSWPGAARRWLSSSAAWPSHSSCRRSPMCRGDGPSSPLR